MNIAGIDEAGRGCIIGPMVMCCVNIDEKEQDAWKLLGIKDSKQLTVPKREKLYEKLINNVNYELQIYTANEVDEAVLSSTTNLNWLEADGTIRLLKGIDAKCYIDCPSTNTNSYKQYLKKELTQDLIVEHKADVNYTVVGMASVIAKVTRDNIIHKIKKEVGFDFGSGYLNGTAIYEFLKNYKSKHIRKSWNYKMK